MNLSEVGIEEFALYIHTVLEKNGIQSVLVGGACVSIYSENRYQSFDLDFVTYADRKAVRKVLSEIGFYEKDRHFEHRKCPYLIDFCNPPVAVGNEPVKKYKRIRSHLGTLQLLTPTDCVKDRLASYYYWNDLQGLEQALMVAQRHKIDLSNVENWSRQEGFLGKFRKFAKDLKIRRPS